MTDMVQARPLLAACMNCGQKCRVNVETDLGADGWRFNDLHGWLCYTCARLDLHPARRKAGQPPKRG
jgi:hypothetical protein